MINIAIKEKDAELFQEFCKYYKIFAALKTGGVFEIKRGEATLNFNDKGELIDIWIRRLGYKKSDYLKQNT